MIVRTAYAATMLMLAMGAAHGQERWWLGTYEQDVEGGICQGGDSLTSFEAVNVYPFEESCTVIAENPLDGLGLQAVALDIACGYPDAPTEAGHLSRWLVVPAGETAVTIYPAGRTLERCTFQ